MAARRSKRLCFQKEKGPPNDIQEQEVRIQPGKKSRSKPEPQSPAVPVKATPPATSQKSSKSTKVKAKEAKGTKSRAGLVEAEKPPEEAAPPTKSLEITKAKRAKVTKSRAGVVENDNPLPDSQKSSMAIKKEKGTKSGADDSPLPVKEAASRLLVHQKSPKTRSTETKRSKVAKNTKTKNQPEEGCHEGVQNEEDIRPSPALFIDPILSEILKYLPTWDLLKCRLVCSEWADQITRFLSVKALLTVNFTERHSGAASFPTSSVGFGAPANIQLFTSLMEASKRIPLSNYIVDSYNISAVEGRPAHKLSAPYVQNLFRVCGQNMRHVQITILPHFTDIRLFIRELSKIVPTLESLHLLDFPEDLPGDSGEKPEGVFDKLKKFKCSQRVSFTSQDGSKKTNSGWKVLFETMPKLEDVELISETKVANQVGDDMVEGLNESGRMSSITSLSFSRISTKALSVLIEAGQEGKLALEEFSTGEVRDDQGTLQKFLDTQQKSLLNLNFGTVTGYPKSTMDLQGRTRAQPSIQLVTLYKMNHIRSLAMNVTVSGVLLKAGSNKSLEDLPNLRTVSFHDCKEATNRKMSPNFRVPSVEDLRINFDHKASAGLFTALSEMFPRVQTLTITCITPRQMQEVVNAWPELKRLNLRIEDCIPEKIEDLRTAGFDGLLKILPAMSRLRELKQVGMSEVNSSSPGWIKHHLFFNVPKM